MSFHLLGRKTTRAFRVLWLLEELGVDYDFTPMEPRSDDVRALNHTGKVPVLKHGDLVLSDSVAIMTYISDYTGQFTHKAGSERRARQDQLTQFLVSEVDAVIWAAAKHAFALPKEQRVQDARTTAKWEFMRAQDWLLGYLGDNLYLSGETPTIADILATHCLDWVSAIKWDVDPRFDPYLSRMRTRPAYVRAQTK